MVLGLITRMREGRRSDVCEDGFGQSLADDARFFVRFRALKHRAIVWREPDSAEEHEIETHPILGQFGDCTIAVADEEGRRCIVRERLWHGWPDPPEFVFFALSPDGSVWAARDFHHWPASWTRPPSRQPL